MRKTEKLTKSRKNYSKRRPIKQKGGRTRRRRRKLNRLGKFTVLIAGLLAVLILLTVGYKCYQNLPYWLYPTPYYTEIAEQAEKSDLKPELVLAIAKVESGFNPDAISPVGAVGIMQVMPDTARWLADKLGEEFAAERLSEVEYNLHFGTEYLRFLLDYWGGDVCRAVASYNAGQTKVAEWLKSGVWDGSLEAADNIPYAETRDYVKRVLEVYRQYLELY